MGFWGSLGKGLLKVGKIAAPIALGLTGVGLPAAMAVGGGLNALDKKVSGGSWGQALGSGLMGAGMGAASSALSPTSGLLSKLGIGGGSGARAAVNSVANRVNSFSSPSIFSKFMQSANALRPLMGQQQPSNGYPSPYRTPPFVSTGNRGYGGMPTSSPYGIGPSFMNNPLASNYSYGNIGPANRQLMQSNYGY